MILTREDYTVAWICALPLEMTAAKAMLDTLHSSQPQSPSDHNTYTLGSISEHNIVIACLPTGVYGVTSASVVLSHLLITFPAVRFGMMVGIGGGVPSTASDIRLGDVVVSVPTPTSGGVIQYDYGKALPSGVMEPIGSLNKPPPNLLTAISQIRSNSLTKETSIEALVSEILQKNEKLRELFSRPNNDWLFVPTYDHMNIDLDCSACDQSQLVDRVPRMSNEPVIHFGLIASGNQVMKNARTRDMLAKKLGILCFEMEAAGLMDQLPCLVIRGISDYCDSHKQKLWQGYAALTAAAVAKSILKIVPLDNRDQGKNLKARRWVVPFPRNDRFVGRQQEMSYLESLIFHSGKSTRIAIYGLGGIGKTQIALELAYRTREEVPDCSIFWIPCTSYETMDQAYMEVAAFLNITTVEPTKVKEQVKAALERQDSQRWLLIFDNVDDIQMWIKGTATTPPLRDIIPRSENGQIIFTSRNRKLSLRLASSEVVSIPDVDKETAILMLQTLLIRKELLQNDILAFTFLEQLGFLPLAIAQAAAYINENDIDLSDYLSVFKESEATAVDLLSEEFDGEGSHNPVITTWLISFQQIQELNRLSADYLSFIACISPKDIPQSILPPAPSAKKHLEALGLLSAYSFISRHACNSSFSLHRLVHLAMRNWLRKGGFLSLWVQKTVHHLDGIFPSDDHESRQIWKSYLPHTIFVTESKEFQKIRHDYVDLIIRVGKCLRVDGRYEEAKLLFLDCLEIQEEREGPQHLDTLLCVSELGLVLHDLGRYKEAEETYRRSLEGYRAVLGLEHPFTLTSADGLALVLQYQGKYQEAEAMNRQALEGYQRLLGPEHPDSLTSLSILGSLLRYQGRFQESEVILRETLENRENVLGLEHPDTLNSTYELALLLTDQGKAKEAEVINQRVLDWREKNLGPDHPDTLACSTLRSAVLRDQGKYREAEVMSQQTLESYKKALGPEHPNTISSMSMLGAVLSHQSKYREAEAVLRQALELSKAVLGLEHPDTLNNMDNFGLVLQYQGKYPEAQVMHQQALDKSITVRGPEHPDTISSMSMLGAVLSYQSKYREAEAVLRQALELSKAVLGLEHPKTLNNMDNLGLVLQYQGKYLEAQVMHQQALDKSNTVRGPEHPDTLISMSNLAHALKGLRKDQDALALMTKCLQVCKKVLEPSHPHVKLYAEAIDRWELECGLIHPHCDQSMVGISTECESTAVSLQPRTIHSSSSEPENRLNSLARTYFGEHPLMRASWNTSSGTETCDLDEVD